MSETEIAIGQIWMRLLDLQSIDRNANFFELGGNSILAMKAVSEVKAIEGTAIPLRSIVMDTLAQIAEQYDQMRRRSESDRESGLKRFITSVFGS